MNYFLIFSFLLLPDSECKDIDECRHLNGSPVEFTYSYPTFLNLPGDEWTMSSYTVQPCKDEEACVNLFYKDGLGGFRCVPKNQTFAAVAIGGLDWNSEVDVLTADHYRCDGTIPKWHTSFSHHHKVI